MERFAASKQLLMLAAWAGVWSAGSTLLTGSEALTVLLLLVLKAETAARESMSGGCIWPAVCIVSKACSSTRVPVAALLLR